MKQYVDFYHTQKEQINAHASHILNDVREDAFPLLIKNGLAHKDADYYRFFNLEELFSLDYGFNINRINPNLDQQSRCKVPTLSDASFYMVNDSLITDVTALPDGVTICSLREACEKFPDIVEQHYASITDAAHDGVQAFNMTFAQDGMFIHIANGVKAETPIQIVNILHGNSKLMCVPHNLIVIGEEADVKLIVYECAMDNVHLMTNAITEMHLSRGAQCHYYRVENTNEQTTNIHTLYVNEEQNAHLNACLMGVHNGTSRSNTIVNLLGKEAEVNLSGLFIGKHTQTYDNATTINHRVGGCHSNQVFKYVLDDEAQGNFLGRILVDKGATGTEAYQVNRNICLTSNARMRTKPQLEIYNDDVKCNHGATIGQLNDEAMFYMQQRGIPKKEAQMLLLEAFLNDVCQNVAIDSLREHVISLIERRLRGNECSLCGNCKAKCSSQIKKV